MAGDYFVQGQGPPHVTSFHLLKLHLHIAVIMILLFQVPNELSDNQHSVDMVQDLFAARREGMMKRGGMHVVRLSEQSIVDR
jgi:hypothetical protein